MTQEETIKEIYKDLLEFMAEEEANYDPDNEFRTGCHFTLDYVTKLFREKGLV